MPVTIDSIYRYPVKGLSAESLDRVPLSAGQSIAHDRRFAIAHASTFIDPEKPEWLPKTSFYMLMCDEKLAQLQTRFDEHSRILALERFGQLLLSACITDSPGRKSLEAFFAEFLGCPPESHPKLVEARGHTFSDARQKPNSTTRNYVSLVNLASVRALEQAAQVPVDPARFRANVYFEGLDAWREFDWVGSELEVGGARLRVVSPITRCPATAVNPATAERDLDIPRILLDEFAHNHMGVYAEVVESGSIAINDAILPG